jgi:hypothetical protein
MIECQENAIDSCPAMPGSWMEWEGVFYDVDTEMDLAAIS